MSHNITELSLEVSAEEFFVAKEASEYKNVLQQGKNMSHNVTELSLKVSVEEFSVAREVLEYKKTSVRRKI